MIAGRASTRIVASRSAIAQIQAAGVQVPPIVAEGTTAEIARATAAARGAAETWAGHAADAAAEGATQAETIAAARDRSLWKVRQISITETAETYSAEVNRIAGEVNRTHPVIWKVWDSVLDRRTCPVCGSAHGTSVPADQRFPQGEPGAVHPFCRCQTVLLTREQVDRETARGSGTDRAMVVVQGGKAKPGASPTPAPQSTPERTAAGQPRPPLTVLRGGRADEVPESGRRPLTRPRRIDVLPLPPSSRTPAAKFKAGRPPTKVEVRERKKAQRRAAMGGR